MSLAIGERFTIAVRDNASDGDYWRVVTPKPDAAVVTGVDEVLDLPEASETADGIGGIRYYTFEAKGNGTTTITLFNCYRTLCSHPKLGDDESRKRVVRNTYTVTVR
ncbi:protease inhibitor I42 family protein [Kitasatospora sp. NPDC056531]|uniref:protease inhibitor I42 family protein n=1 Tax=Kitasatospora sp. NPDC056531 TaxID=3345856 RepID=UPI003692CD54